MDRLAKVGGTSGHAEMVSGYDYDSVCTAIDTELYKMGLKMPVSPTDRDAVSHAELELRHA